MISVEDLTCLNLPAKYLGYLTVFLQNISAINSVEKIILFGSCAREEAVSDKSDIDLLVLGDKINSDDELSILFDCPPQYGEENYIPSDIIIGTLETFEKYKNENGMVQKQISREGIDLSGYLTRETY